MDRSSWRGVIESDAFFETQRRRLHTFPFAPGHARGCYEIAGRLGPSRPPYERIRLPGHTGALEGTPMRPPDRPRRQRVNF